MPALAIRPEEIMHPLDVAESAAIEREWSCDRTEDGDILAEARGMWGRYQMWFAWHEHIQALTLTASFESPMPKPALAKVHALLALVNEKIWVGHFGLNTQTLTVAYRHTLLLQEEATSTSDPLRQMIDIGLNECDRFYPALQAVAWGGKAPQEALDYAMFETVGEA